MENVIEQHKVRPAALVQLVSSERVIGGLLLVAVVALTLLFPALFAAHTAELVAIVAALVAQFVGLHTYVKINAGLVVLQDDKGRPLFEPLGKLWKSRKFVTTLIGLALELLVAVLPMTEPIRNQLFALILLVVISYNGALAKEDVEAVSFFRKAQRTRSEPA